MLQLQMIFKMNIILANIEGLNPFRLLDLAFFVLVIDFACIFLTFPILKLFEISPSFTFPVYCDIVNVFFLGLAISIFLLKGCIFCYFVL